MSVQQKQNDEYVVGTAHVSEIVGLSKRRINQLANSDVFPKLGRGKYDIRAVVQGYIDYIKSSADNEEELDYKKEKTLLTREQRKKVEIEVKILKGELHRSEDVEFVMNRMLAAIKAKLLALPTKTAPRVQGITDLAVIKDIIKAEVYEALSELSEYSADVFYGESKDKLLIESDTTENKKRLTRGHAKGK